MEAPDVMEKKNSDTLILAADGTQSSDDAILDTGMTVKQAVTEAMVWWEAIGRKEIRANHATTGNRHQRRRRSAFFNANPTTDAQAENSFPSGIMNAKAWADLTRDERLQIVRHWHHNHVRLPMGKDTEGLKRLVAVPGKCFYCANDGEVFEDLPNGESREMCVDHWRDRYPKQFAKARH